MDKLSKQLYALEDTHTRMIKVGSATDVDRRKRQVEAYLGYKLSLLFSFPGHDYFMEHVPIPRARHPRWIAGGDGEWYHDTPEIRGFLDHIQNLSHCINIQDFIIDSWMHKYTVA